MEKCFKKCKVKVRREEGRGAKKAIQMKPKKFDKRKRKRKVNQKKDKEN